MKKMIVTIIILFIIFITMVIYKSTANQTEVTINEVNKIQNYIEKIYAWKEITNEALPTFDNINNADEKWIWGTIRENIDEYEIEYATIENKAKEIFGNNFNKQYPKEGTEFIIYDNQTQNYLLSEINLDAIDDAFLLNKIEKNKNEYNVEIIEYLVDYSDFEDGKITIKNLNNETIYEIINIDLTKEEITKIVKENINKFTKKKITLEKEGENIVIKKVEKE